jgi:hypothetical protein
MMKDTLKPLILTALASGRPTFHEAMPDSFGRDPRRWDLLRDCLLTLLQAHQGLEIRLVGSLSALDAFGLRSGVDEVVGTALVPVTLGATDSPQAIRLIFRPAPAPRQTPGKSVKRHEHLEKP